MWLNRQLPQQPKQLFLRLRIITEAVPPLDARLN